MNFVVKPSLVPFFVFPLVAVLDDEAQIRKARRRLLATHGFARGSLMERLIPSW